MPHKKEEVTSLCEDALNVFWEKRRYGESWDDLTPPDSYYGTKDLGKDNESTSRRAYKKLVFDLAGDILREIYAEEEEDEVRTEAAEIGHPLQKRKKFFKGRTPPTTPDAVLPVIREHVLNFLSLSGEGQRGLSGLRTVRKWSSRKKRDAVDEVLLAELKEEEPQWVDYLQDEYAVKMQVADAIFDNLLIETAQCFANATSRKQRTATS